MGLIVVITGKWKEGRVGERWGVEEPDPFRVKINDVGASWSVEKVAELIVGDSWLHEFVGAVEEVIFFLSRRFRN